jgi:hypothetical protein
MSEADDIHEHLLAHARDACPKCGASLSGEFHASGVEAMAVQEKIFLHHDTMVTIRTIAAYGVSVVFVIVGAVLIAFAPDDRTTAANITAGALLVLAAGIAGFTRLNAKVPGLSIQADAPERAPGPQ